MSLVAWAAISSAIVLPYVRDHWQDEVQIIEIARGGIVDKAEPWSMLATGDPKIDSQSWAIYYVGGWLFERMYQCMGHLGPRILTMFAYFILSALFGVYLFKKTGDKLIASLLAVLLWSFPPLQLCARGVRADILSMLFCTGGMLVLQVKVSSLTKKCLVFSLAGTLYALSILTWISAILLGPVVLWEMVEQLEFKRTPPKSWALPFLCCVGAGIVTGVLLLLPFIFHFVQTVEVSKLVWQINTFYAEKEGRLLWKEFALCMLQPPGLYVLGFCLLASSRRFLILFFGFAACAVLCMMTKVYSTRIVYFLPYVLIGVGVGIQTIRRQGLRRLIMWIVGCMTLLAYGRTYICRNLTDYRVRHHRDYAALRPVIEQKLGRNISVYADTFQLYYLGRELNWKQYHYLVQWVLPPTNLLARVDACISCAEGEKNGFAQHLADKGFKFAFCIDQPIPKPDWLTRHIPTLGGDGAFLGPYNVYRRTYDENP